VLCFSILNHLGTLVFLLVELSILLQPQRVLFKLIYSIFWQFGLTFVLLFNKIDGFRFSQIAFYFLV
jgi:hypothetical protein